MPRPRRDLGGRPVGKNSISEMASKDPALRKKLHENERKYNADRLAFEAWAAGGCLAGYEVL